MSIVYIRMHGIMLFCLLFMLDMFLQVSYGDEIGRKQRENPMLGIQSQRVADRWVIFILLKTDTLETYPLSA